MPTLTIRNVPAKTVRALKTLAKRNGHSMEQELREMLKQQVLDRASAMAQIEQFWASKERRATPEEIDAAIREGRR
jgi:plasmid stability protein